MAYNSSKIQPNHSSCQSTKNNRRISATVTAQTMGHLEALAREHGWSTKDFGRTIDHLMKTYLNDHRQTGKKQEDRKWKRT